MSDRAGAAELLNELIEGRLTASPHLGEMAALAALARSCRRLRVPDPTPAAQARMRAKFWSAVERERRWFGLALPLSNGLRERLAAGMIAVSLLGGGASYAAGHSPAAALEGAASFLRAAVLSMAPSEPQDTEPGPPVASNDAGTHQPQTENSPLPGAAGGDDGTPAAGPAGAPTATDGTTQPPAATPTSSVTPPPRTSPTPTPTAGGPTPSAPPGQVAGPEKPPPPSPAPTTTPSPPTTLPPSASPSPFATPTPSATPTPVPPSVTPAPEEDEEEDEDEEDDESQAEPTQTPEPSETPEPPEEDR